MIINKSHIYCGHAKGFFSAYQFRYPSKSEGKISLKPLIYRQIIPDNDICDIKMKG